MDPSICADAVSVSYGKANQDNQNDILNEVNRQIVHHPLYLDLIRCLTDCRVVGAPDDVRQRLEEDQLQPLIQRLQQESQSSQDNYQSDPELDRFLQEYILLLLSHKEELQIQEKEGINLLNYYQQQIAEILAGEESDVLDTDEENNMIWFEKQDQQEVREALKTQYGHQLIQLKQQFQPKQKKQCLPRSSQEILKVWWQNNFVWPYPSDEEKRSLMSTTGLSQNQITNWFNNQRKRHWLPMFPTRPPTSKEQSEQILRSLGVLKY